MKHDDLFLQYEREVAEFKLSLIRRLAKDSASPGQGNFILYNYPNIFIQLRL